MEISDSRTNIFTVQIDTKGTNITYKTLKIVTEVTRPNEFGIFKIITKIGDEQPQERLISLDNEKIVKTE